MKTSVRGNSSSIVRKSPEQVGNIMYLVMNQWLQRASFDQ
jgi:hypothetical protein